MIKGAILEVVQKPFDQVLERSSIQSTIASDNIRKGWFWTSIDEYRGCTVTLNQMMVAIKRIKLFQNLQLVFERCH